MGPTLALPALVLLLLLPPPSLSQDEGEWTAAAPLHPLVVPLHPKSGGATGKAVAPRGRTSGSISRVAAIGVLTLVSSTPPQIGECRRCRARSWIYL